MFLLKLHSPKVAEVGLQMDEWGDSKKFKISGQVVT